jgi:hypothetical protein
MPADYRDQDIAGTDFPFNQVNKIYAVVDRVNVPEDEVLAEMPAEPLMQALA